MGLALRLRNAQVIAFEMEPSAQELIRRLAQLNGVESRVALEGFCTCEKLSAALKDSGKTMLVCDAEGGEFTLLDPMTIPRLRECHILVELHDQAVRGLSDEIRARFTSTHEITQIFETRRDRSEFPYRTLYTTMFPYYVDWALSEARGGNMAWYWMRPRAEDNAPRQGTHAATEN